MIKVEYLALVIEHGPVLVAVRVWAALNLCKECLFIDHLEHGHVSPSFVHDVELAALWSILN